MTFYDPGAPARIGKRIRATVTDSDEWGAHADHEAAMWAADRYGWPLDAGERAQARELADAIRHDLGVAS